MAKPKHPSNQHLPDFGWYCSYIEDLEEVAAVCQWCCYTDIRYVHTMEHPDTSEVRYTGCICAGLMERNPEAARRREAVLKSRTTRRDKWLQRNWIDTHKGMRLKSNGYMITVFPRAGAYSFSIRKEDNVYFSKVRYANSFAAKLAAFDCLNPKKITGA